MTFEYWIKTYMKHDKEARQLLDDYLFICKTKKELGKKKPKLDLNHLHENDACEDVINTYNRLINLYANDVTSIKSKRW